MSRTELGAALEARAAACGVATGYVDGTGVLRRPPASTIEAILDLLPPVTPTADAASPASADAPTSRCATGPQPPHTWGVFAPLAGLRSGREIGLGDLTTLRTFAEAAVALGAGVVGTLPLLATRPDESSPYSPLTRRYWDERWLDVAWLAECLGEPYPAPKPTPRQERTHPEPAWQLRRSQARALLASSAARSTVAPTAWVRDRPGVERWARWKAVAERAGWDPRAWSPELDRAVRSGDDATLAAHGVERADVEFEIALQWAVSTQLAELGDDLRDEGVALYLDLPVGTSASGFDVWEAPEDFAVGMSIGAPPDRFFPGGQSWGLVPPLPGRGDLARCLQAHMSVCGLLRIDHVMGLHRLFWIPDGAEASDGTYVTYDARHNWSVVAEMSVAHDCGVVGEDLGTVPDEVRVAMAEVGARGLFIAQDETRAPFRLSRPVPESTIASLNTHDLPPFAAWHEAWGVDATAPVVRDHLLAELAASEADIVLVSEQDLSLDPRRLNVPGEVGGDIWRLVSRLGADELATGATATATDARRVLADVD
ncbi:MAG: 4-alpha-glucanotransferase, partial [Candidatus Nanopelagicales bacterium]